MRFPHFKIDLICLIQVIGIAIFAIATALQVSAEERSDSGDVVAVGGSVTEIIYALGEQDRLLARDSTSSYPAETQDLPSVGYIRALSPEGVLSVGPRLIIAEEGAGPPEAVDVLRNSSVTYVDVPDAPSVSGIIDKILIVGQALGAPEKADALARDVSNDLQAALHAVAAQPVDQRRVLFVLSTQGGRIMASGANTAADSIIQLAGGENVMRSFDGYKAVTEEAVAVAQPDVILMMDRGGDHSSSNEELWSLPAFADTPAAGRNAVVRMNGLLLLGFGPRTPQAIEDLHSTLLDGS